MELLNKCFGLARSSLIHNNIKCTDEDMQKEKETDKKFAFFSFFFYLGLKLFKFYAVI